MGGTLAIDLNNYLSSLRRATNNLQDGLLKKTLESDYDLYEEYIRQVEWLIDNKDKFEEQAAQQNREQELNDFHQQLVDEFQKHLDN